jgi:prepilin-type N-terminal cleavage/methylation domain-containing protein
MRPPPTTSSKGFTLVELLIAAAIGAAVITAAVLGFGIITNLSSESGSVNVELPGGAISDLYGAGSPFITVGANPNYFQGIQSRQLKDRLVRDAAAGTAVFCLGRNFRGSPAVRPMSLPVQQGTDFRTNTSPEALRTTFSAQLGAFPASQSGALNWAMNVSIFVLGTLDNVLQSSNNLAVLAIYEVDFIPTTEPAGGTFATVRRFSGTNNAVPTDYYHAFYPDEANGADGFRPLAAFFPRSAAGGGEAFALATNRPFSFVWWPDPLVSKLEGEAVPTGAAVPGSYANMGNRTGLFFVLPTFPPL